ncbi:hypothetical protein [Azospirillum picis]|uniref:DUF2214 domain-containing protein n=1 Tax=Azospirillum picis TaxID=488438 RepID=A0ABU0MID3_9PROT|nr:hypothetical protein [Azospirillum picis]MBP2299211.1 hypothetical protein [Azospirillum picis]MDQ0533151.1 hypothetical protein [Azospirillum picis]
MDHGQGPAGPGWLVALETSGLGEALRQSVWVYPLVEVLHILGLALLVGAVAAFDLRLLGVGCRLPASPLSRLLLPVAATGLALTVPTGTLLFISEATALAANPAFLAKMALLVLALANIALFHHGAGRTIAAWDGRPPPMARVAGAVSLALWVGVLALGRLIAYL